ncbi:MAG: glycoside hydrolase family 13 protein [Lachnospiraceae bacterium]|nr:glycoside hydrolase family 13 protein [Lachnospiraceae bacterium]
MRKEAILHIPLSQYAYAADERSITVRLRTAKNDIEACFLYYGNRVDEVEPIKVTELKMEICATDDLFDYFEAVISSDYNRVCYYFKLVAGTEEQFLYSRGFCDVMEANRTEYFQYPYIRREELLQKPEWARNAVMYHIFPDSFANGRRRIDEESKCIDIYENGSLCTENTGSDAGNTSAALQLAGSNTANTEIRPVKKDKRGHSKSLLGGTIRGIIENIDYLKSLGVNLLYLNPIFKANSYHKYDTIDYFEIDPCFGTKADFKELVDILHENGIRIVLDGVFNHCGPDFFAFKDVLEKGENSKYCGWFYKLNFPIKYEYPPNYECFAYVKDMPKLNTGNPEVRDYICRVGKYWISEFGIDGWRLDVANEVDHDTWRAFRRAVLEERPDAFLIAEIWEDADVWLKGDQFDSAMNYIFTYLCRDFFASGTIGAKEFDEQMNKALMRYPAPVANVQMNMLDSHDVPRFLHYCGGNTDRLKLAFFYMMTAPGIPSVFYGDELYMTGEKESEYRSPFPWEKLENGFTAELSEWIEIRKKHPALTEGGYRKVYADDKGLYVFERRCADESLFVVINNSDTGRRLRCEDIFAEGADSVYMKAGSCLKDDVLFVSGFGGAVLKRN